MTKHFLEPLHRILAEERESDPASALESAKTIETFAKKQLKLAVDEARAAGMPWAEIGDRLGISKQAAWERFGYEPSVPPPPINRQRRCGTQKVAFGGTCILPVDHDGDHVVKPTRRAKGGS